MCQAALADLDPVVAVGDVDLPPRDRVGVHGRHGPPPPPRQRGPDDPVDQLFQRHLGQGPADVGADAPDVELVWLPDVLPVDHVAPVDHPRTHQRHVVAASGRDLLQRQRHHRAGVAAEHQLLGEVAAVARVTRSRAGLVAEPVVVVADRDDRVGVTAGNRRRGIVDRVTDRVDQVLDGVVAL